MLYRDGYAKITLSYDQRKRIKQVAIFDIDGMPILNSYGVATIILNHDEHRNISELSFYGVNGEAVLAYGICDRVFTKLDGKFPETDKGLCFNIKGEIEFLSTILSLYLYNEYLTVKKYFTN